MKKSKTYESSSDVYCVQKLAYALRCYIIQFLKVMVNMEFSDDGKLRIYFSLFLPYTTEEKYKSWKEIYVHGPRIERKIYHQISKHLMGYFKTDRERKIYTFFSRFNLHDSSQEWSFYELFRYLPLCRSDVGIHFEIDELPSLSNPKDLSAVDLVPPRISSIKILGRNWRNPQPPSEEIIERFSRQVGGVFQRINRLDSIMLLGFGFDFVRRQSLQKHKNIIKRFYVYEKGTLSMFFKILEYLPSLTSLCFRIDTDEEVLKSWNTEIKSTRIRKLEIGGIKLDDFSFAAIYPALPALTYLTVGRNIISGDGWKKFFQDTNKRNKNLRTLDFLYSSKESIPPSKLDESKQIMSLENLRIRKFDEAYKEVRVLDQELEYFCCIFPNLERLESPIINTKQTGILKSKLKNLTSLVLNRIFPSSEEKEKELYESLVDSHIENLTVKLIDFEHLEVFTRWKRLRNLSIGYKRIHFRETIEGRNRQESIDDVGEKIIAFVKNCVFKKMKEKTLHWRSLKLFFAGGSGLSFTAHIRNPKYFDLVLVVFDILELFKKFLEKENCSLNEFVLGEYSSTTPKEFIWWKKEFGFLFEGIKSGWNSHILSMQ